MDLERINKALKSVHNYPSNKWDYGKMHELYENNIKEAIEKLGAYKRQMSEVETRCRSRGIDEIEIQKEMYRSFSHGYINCLERVLEAKKQLDSLEMGNIEELTRKKIAILEEMVARVPVP